MNEFVGANIYLNAPISRLPGEVFRKLHLQLTSLAVAQLERRDEAEDIASACLLDLWEVSLPIDDLISVELFLHRRLIEQIALNKRNRKQRTAAEQHYVANRQIDDTHERFVLHQLDRVMQRLPLLDQPEQQVLRFVIEDGLSLEQVAYRLAFPISKVNRLCQHAVYRLRKELGLLKRYW